MRIRHLVALVVVPMLLSAPAAHAAGTITGTVTRDNGSTPETPGAAISGACVRALNLNGDPSVVPSVVETTTDVYGNYTLSVSANGRWGVQFYTCPNVPGHSFVAEWYPDSREAFGTQLTIADGATVTRDASLADGGSIAGVVTDPEGQPVEGACVTPYNQGIWENLPPARTNAQGEYRIGGLLGQYVVAFDVGYEGCAPDKLLLFEYYGNTRNSDNASVLHMTDGTHLFPPNGVNAQLEAAASITGVVTDHTGAPIEGACVSLGPATEEGDGGGFAYTGADGRYTIKPVVPGSYKLRFDPCGESGDVAEYWENKTTEASATVVTLDAGAQPTEYSAQLSEPPSLDGTVTDSDGAALAGVCVAVYKSTSGSQIANTTTDSQGEYTFGAQALSSLGGAQALIEFSACSSGAMYYGEWYNDQPDQESATPVTVSGPTTADAVLAKAYGITGVVKDTAGNPIQNECVFLGGSDPGLYYAGSTGSDGTYSTGPLPPGDYVVRFGGCSGGWLSEYYNDSPNRAGADPVTVTDTSGAVADAELVQGGVISGIVSGPSGPVADVCVSLRRAATGTPIDIGSPRTNASGEYVIEGLRTGSYIVRFEACYQGPNLQGEFYDDAATLEDADPVDVTAGQTTGSVDATLAEGATLTGQITNAEGQGVYGCPAVETLDGRFVTDKATDANGNYSIDKLTPGQYILAFNTSCSNGEYMREYWNNVHRRADAQPFTITAAGPNVANVVLDRGGSISGKVTGPDGLPAADVCVEVRDAQSGEYLPVGASTDGDGEYLVTGIRAGQVKVRFHECGQRDGKEYLAEYYEDARRFGAARAITVEDNKTTPDIDASLAYGASISGTVTGPDGDPIGYACVNAEADRGESVNAETNEDGEYTIGGLPAGSYKLEFQPCGADAGSEWWNDKPSRAAADPIVLGEGEEVTGKDAQLPPRPTGAIEGTVIDPFGEYASTGCVTAYDVATGDSVRGDQVQDGAYRITRLPAGDYKVEFSGCGSNFATEFWGGAGSDGVSTFAEAATIHLNTGETVDGINAELVTGATISGRVTVPAGISRDGICVEVYGADDPDFAFSGPDLRPDGSYTAGGLPVGDYKVLFEPECYGQSSRLALEYYEDASGFDDAEVIEIHAAGETITDIDAALEIEPVALTVTSGPTGQTANTQPAFGFDAPDDSDLDCSIDTGTPSWGPCSTESSHVPAAALADGSYTFRVRATTDWEQLVATRSFSVQRPADPTIPTDPTDPTGPTGPTGTLPGPDTVAPSIKIDKGPSGKTTDRTPKFTFSSSDPTATFTCSVDRKPAAPCASPVTLKKLGLGRHVFKVTATDAAGNAASDEQPFKIKKKRRRHHG